MDLAYVIVCVSSAVCTLEPHGNNRCREQQPRRVLSHMTNVANRRLRVNLKNAVRNKFSLSICLTPSVILEIEKTKCEIYKRLDLLWFLFQKIFPIQSSLAQKSIEHVYVGAQKFGSQLENNFIGCVQVCKMTLKLQIKKILEFTIE